MRIRKKAAGYLRMSTKEQDTSIADQRKAVVKLAARELVGMVHDYRYNAVDAQQALRELGLAVPKDKARAMLKNLLPPGGESYLGIVPEDARVAIREADASFVFPSLIQRRKGARNRRAKGLIILSKRADLYLEWQREFFPEGLPSWVWPGMSMGTQAGVDERMRYLLQIKASVRVVSAEPLIEFPLDPLQMCAAQLDPDALVSSADHASSRVGSHCKTFGLGAMETWSRLSMAASKTTALPGEYRATRYRWPCRSIW